MTGIKILGTGHYVPDYVVTNNDFTGIVDTSDEWIRTRTGMNRRHISLGEPTWHMGMLAARRALEAAGKTGKDIDMIVVTTVTTDFFFPSIASIIQEKIGAVNAFSMDISVACAGLTYSLDMARRYLATGDVETVLVIGTENLSNFLNYEDRGTCILFGDGAGALVVEKSDKPFASWLYTEASGVHQTYCKRVRNPLPFAGQPEYEELLPFPLDVDGLIYMNGREVYKFATRSMPLAVKNACGKLGWEVSDIDLLVPHQANLRIIETALKNLDFPMEKVYVGLQEYSNTSSASIIIGLDECARSGRLKRGDKVCIVGFGAGLSLGANAFVY